MFPIENPALLLALLLAVALAVPLLCERIKIPGIVGLILAGVVLGPNVGGIIERGELVALLGQAGLLFIVFVAGLEIDLARFKRYRGHSIVFGSISYLIPQTLGAVMAVYVLGFDWAPAILLGSMFGSHTLLAYPVAARLGITKSMPITTAVGGTIVTDVAALMVLAVVANGASGEGTWDFWTLFGILLVLYTILVFAILPRAARWFYRTVPDEGARDFLFTVLMLFVFAWLAEFIGLQPILGAFLCGIALNRLIPERSPLMNRVQFVGKTLLVPMFLLSVGMLVDPRALVGDWETIGVVAMMSFTVIVSKWLGAFAAGGLLRYPVRDCWVLYGMSVNQAAATLAAVVVGFELGLFNEAVVNGAIIMILTTTVVGPWCTERWGREVAKAVDYEPMDFTELPQRILIPVANPQTVEPLMDLALLLREPSSREPIYPLAIVTEGSDVEAKLNEAEKLLARATVRGAAGDCPIYPVTRVDVNIAEGIRRALVEQQVTTVVIGWSGYASSIAHRIFGGVLDQLLAQSRQAIVVARMTRSLNSVRRVIVAVPRAAESEPTFAESIHLIKIISQQLSAPILLVGPDVESKRLLMRVRRTRPEVMVTTQMITRLRDLPDELKAVLSPDDLLILLSARSHRLSWISALETLPRRIAARFADVPFLVVYPPEEAGSVTATGDDSADDREEGVTDWATPSDANVRDLLVHPGHILIQPKTHDLAELMRLVLQATFAEKTEAVAELTARLVVSAREYPIALNEGAYLLHTHGREVLHPLFYVVVFGEEAPEVGFGGATPVKVLFILVTPDTFSPERHLRLLRSIASALREGTTLRAITEADNPGLVYNTLQHLNERW